jgi:hypothetical protein
MKPKIALDKMSSTPYIMISKLGDQSPVPSEKMNTTGYLEREESAKGD